MGGGEYIQQKIIEVTPEVVVNIPEPKINYWYGLALVIIPVLLAWFLRKKK